MYCFSLSAVFKPSWKKLQNNKKVNVNLTDVNKHQDKYESHLGELLLCKCQVLHYEGDTEGGRERRLVQFMFNV